MNTTEIVASIEAQIRDHETKAGALRDVLAALRAAYGLTPLDAPAPIAPVASPPAPAKPKAKVTRATVNGAAASPPADELDGTARQILKFLQRQKEPVRMPAVVEAAGTTRYLADKAVESLIAGGHVVKTGKTYGLRLGVPAVMAAAAAAAKEAL